MNRLLFGDNLKWLRDARIFPDASVDLVYLDPPFNSNADYNVLFREASGEASQAQFHAFTDSWNWADAARTYAVFVDDGRRDEAAARLLDRPGRSWIVSCTMPRPLPFTGGVTGLRTTPPLPGRRTKTRKSNPSPTNLRPQNRRAEWFAFRFCSFYFAADGL
jgi:hypothetical protein